MARLLVEAPSPFEDIYGGLKQGSQICRCYFLFFISFHPLQHPAMAALASVQKIGRKTTPLREGMNVVRQILHSPDNAGGMTPRQLYKAALEVPVPAAFVPPEPLQSKEVPHNKTGRLRQVPAPPPHPEHPVRSLTCVFLPHRIQHCSNMIL